MKCIVLDIDNTLVHTNTKIKKHLIDTIMTEEKYYYMRRRIYNVKKSGNIYYGVKRPYLEDFINFCFLNFDYVCVWSAAEKNYVYDMTKIIFCRSESPDLVFTGEQTTYINGNPVKDLNIIADALSIKLDDIVAVDDTLSTFSKNPDNAILIYKYTVDNNIESIQKTDDCLLKIQIMLS